MPGTDRFKIDKTKLSVGDIADVTEERDYWLTKTPHERLEALELIRQVLYGYDPVTARLQRVLEITIRESN